MTREEFRNYIDVLRLQDEISYDVYSELIDGIDTLEPEPKTEFERKAEIVISQIRADRDRLQDAFEKIRANIETIIGERNLDDYDFCSGLILARNIIDKYKKESEE